MPRGTLLYDVSGLVATITLNRPDRLNTIVPPMPDELESAIRAATVNESVKVIVLRVAGRSFCAGYDFGGGFHHWDDALTSDGRWDPGKDFALAASPYGSTQRFMSMWRTPKPVIAQVHGWCVGGGSDLALCADLIIAAEDAQIGGWAGILVPRVGVLSVGDVDLPAWFDQGQGARPDRNAAVRREAADIELINAAVPFDELEATVAEQARQLAATPSSQLAAMKLIVNQAYENMGLHATQTLGPILDGLMRNTPAGLAFVETAGTAGVRAATEQRDAAFGDYSAAGADRRPDAGHIVNP